MSTEKVNSRKQNSNKTKKTNYRKPRNKNIEQKQPLHIIPLGGIGEIGKNCTAYEYDGEYIIVDCGMSFPDEEMPGVDSVIPDFTFLQKNADKIRAMFITHGHEDHIGGLPYFLKDLKIPVYGTRLTLGLIQGKLKEHDLDSSVLFSFEPGEVVKAGPFSVEAIHVNHSIPDAIGLCIKTPIGNVIQTGDFKIDTTPIDGDIIDIARFSELGKKGVLALLSDSTNADRPGYTMSEKTVGESFKSLFKDAGNNRLIVATFSSNIHRIQQIIDEAIHCKRKVAVSGRSMENVVAIAQELGYLKVPDGVLIDIDTIRRYAPHELVIVTTGSQGEPMSALHRMAHGDHRKVSVGPTDTIIISASPIPGNEKTVSKVVNELMKLGAHVIYEKMYEVHVSGHACQEELKTMIAITKPKFFIPVHGEQKHLQKHAGLATTLGMSKKNILVTEIGKVIELTPSSVKIAGTVPAGRVLVDGSGVGDVGSIVLRDRKHLAEDGIIVAVVTIDSHSGFAVSGPDIVSRGFVYVRESEELMEQARNIMEDVIYHSSRRGYVDWPSLKANIRDELSKFFYEQTKRSPMILPIIMEV